MASAATLNRNLITKIATMVSKGAPPKTSANVCGITGPLFSKWMKHGMVMREFVIKHGGFPPGSHKEDWLCAALSEEVEAAHAKAVLRYVRKIDRAATSNWSAAAWWLDRRAKEDFSTKAEVVTQEVSKPTVNIYIPDNGRGPSGA